MKKIKSKKWIVNQMKRGPAQSSTWHIAKSDIHGDGVFASRRIAQGRKVDTAIVYRFFLYPSITSFGSMINHSYNPTAEVLYDPEEKVWNIYTVKSVRKGVEITINYDDTPWFIENAKEEYQ